MFGDVLAGSRRPLVIASGTLGLPPGAGTELDGHELAPGGPFSGASARMSNAEFALGLAARGVRSSVVRLSPTVHGPGDDGFIASLVKIAREKGVSGYIGDGANRWPAVHRLDAGHLFCLALEKAPAGSTLHGVADEGVTLRTIAEVIGRHLGVPAVSVSAENAAGHFAWMAGLLAVDSPASNTVTRQLLGWEPVHPGLIADLELGHYFDAR